MVRALGPPIVALIALIGWVVISAFQRQRGLFEPLAVFAVVLIGLSAAIGGARLRSLLRPRPANVTIGIAGGLVMAALTHLVYRAASALWPALIAPVEKLYGTVDRAPPVAIALALLVLIVFSEELVWRGVVLDGGAKAGVDRRSRAAFLVSAVGYALAQLGAGTPLLAVIAFCCGLIWGAVRLWRRDLVSVLLMHLVWDLGVLFVFPLRS